MLLMSLGLPPPLPLKPSPPDPPITHSEFRPELLVSMMLAPSGSLEVVNKTGSWQLFMGVSFVVQQTECDEPQATLEMWYPSNPLTMAGFRLTVVVEFPC